MASSLQLYALLLALAFSMLNLFIIARKRHSFRVVNSFKTHFYVIIFLYIVAKIVQLYPLQGSFSISLFGLVLMQNTPFSVFVELIYFLMALAMLSLVASNAFGAGLFRALFLARPAPRQVPRPAQKRKGGRKA